MVPEMPVKLTALLTVSELRLREPAPENVPVAMVPPAILNTAVDGTVTVPAVSEPEVAVKARVAPDVTETPAKV